MTDNLEHLQPPQSLDTEQAILGSIMKDPDAMAMVLLVLEDESHFYHRRHQAIFQAALSLHRKDEPIDITTMSDELIRRDKLEEIGGRVYLVDLIESIASTANVVAHSEIVREKSIRRRMINECNEAVRSCYMLEQPIEEIASSVNQEIAGLLTRQDEDGIQRLSTIAVKTMSDIDKHGKGQHGGLTTGFPSLDEITGGLHPGDLWSLGGRPKAGKTSMTANMAIQQCKQGYKVLYFSAETRSEAFTKKIQCIEAEVDFMDWKMGKLSHDDIDRLTVATNKMNEWQFHVIGIPQIEVHLLASQTALWKSKQDIDIVYIDYGQLITTQRYYRNRRDQMDYIIKQFKKLAQRLGIPVVAISQISRDVVKGKSRQPTPADFKETGAWEEHSDILSILWKPPTPKKQVQVGESKMVEVLVWQRNGPTGKKDFIFEAKHTKFKDPELQGKIELDMIPVEPDPF